MSADHPTNWRQGLIYMGAVLAILLFHEMGHFIATLIHRIPASFPFFIPFPISPIGTMGAVIGMAGHRADRRQTFDIGIAGPLAGLVVALPILWMGIRQLDVAVEPSGPFQIDCPWIVRFLDRTSVPSCSRSRRCGSVRSMPISWRPGWDCGRITGLNMMPISQLDGGHVIYALLLKRGHWVARFFLFVAIAYVWLSEAHMWSVMIIIVILIGTDHPPTSNDRLPLGRFRMALGYASLCHCCSAFPCRESS